MLQRIHNITTVSTRILLVVGGLLLATAVQAAEPHFGDVVFAAGEDADSAKEVFATDTPKIYLHAQLEDVDQDTKLSAAWIAEKTDAAPAIPPGYGVKVCGIYAGGHKPNASQCVFNRLVCNK